MTVKERLRYYLKYKKVNERQFCLSIGVSPSYIQSIRVSIQPKKIECIAEQYPDLNTGWLLTGEGSMLKSEDKGANLLYRMMSDPEPSQVKELEGHIETLNKDMISKLLQYIDMLNEKADRLEEENKALKEELKHKEDHL